MNEPKGIDGQLIIIILLLSFLAVGLIDRVTDDPYQQQMEIKR